MSAARHVLSTLVAASAILANAPSRAASGERVVVPNILGPEGPLYVDGNLYFVGWVSGTLSKWDGHTVTVLNNAPNCGHNGLALTKQRTLLLACTDEKGAILELDTTGKELHRWTTDDKGRPFEGGINDIVVTDNGGAYATVFGPYEGKPTTVAGRILYRAPGRNAWISRFHGPGRVGPQQLVERDDPRVAELEQPTSMTLTGSRCRAIRKRSTSTRRSAIAS